MTYTASLLRHFIREKSSELNYFRHHDPLLAFAERLLREGLIIHVPPDALCRPRISSAF